MLIISPSKNAFQNISAFQNCSLKKCIFKTGAHEDCSLKKRISEHECSLKLLPQNMYFKTFIIKISIIIRVYGQ